jgi:hypothetical protein
MGGICGQACALIKGPLKGQQQAATPPEFNDANSHAKLTCVTKELKTTLFKDVYDRACAQAVAQAPRLIAGLYAASSELLNVKHPLLSNYCRI